MSPLELLKPPVGTLMPLSSLNFACSPLPISSVPISPNWLGVRPLSTIENCLSALPPVIGLSLLPV